MNRKEKNEIIAKFMGWKKRKTQNMWDLKCKDQHGPVFAHTAASAPYSYTYDLNALEYVIEKMDCYCEIIYCDVDKVWEISIEDVNTVGFPEVSARDKSLTDALSLAIVEVIKNEQL